MSARKAVIQLATQTGMLIGALFVVTVLLAAIPEHKGAVEQPTSALAGDMKPGLPDADAHTIVVHASPESAQEAQQEPSDSTTADEKTNERAAVQAMTRGDHDANASHMTMTEMRDP